LQGLASLDEGREKKRGLRRRPPHVKEKTDWPPVKFGTQERGGKGALTKEGKKKS